MVYHFYLAEPLMHSGGSLIELQPKPIVATALPDRIYAQLKHRILTCDLLPRQRLIERDICADAAVSRTPLREALNRLALEGLVTLIPYRGYAVAPITIEDIRELWEVREAVESELAALGANRATTSDLNRLASLAELPYEPGKRNTYRRYLRCNSAFHLALARCARNLRLERTSMSVLDQLQRPMYLGLDFGLSTQAATAEHHAIINALKEGNPDYARKIVLQQMESARQRMLVALQKLGPDFVTEARLSLRGKKFRPVERTR